MSVGMMWFNNSGVSLAEKIKRAAEYYHKKYGTRPNMCLVHPIMGLAVVEGITVLSDKTILPSNLWIGMRDKEKYDGTF